MKVAVFFLFSVTFSLTSAFWFKHTTRRNCKWFPWYRDGLCYEVSKNPRRFERTERRVQSPAELGGEPCRGPDTRQVACTAREYSDHVLLRGFFSAQSSNDRTGSSVDFVFSSVIVQNNCVEDFRDEHGNILMGGRTCRRRRKREAEIDSYENALKRSKRGFVNKYRDVLFLIDESGSVGKENFQRCLRFARALTSGFCAGIKIDQHITRVGVMTFDEEQFPQINFDSYFDKAKIINAMNTDTEITYHSHSAGSTCLVDALRYTRSDMFTSARGARITNPNTERLVVLLTDGCANCADNNRLKTTLKSIGEQFTEAGISIFSVLVAADTSSCFDIMRGLQSGSQCYELYSRDSWAALDESSKAIEESAGCMSEWIIGPPCPE